MLIPEEDKATNVFDDKYDQYVDLQPEELGLTTEVEPHLGFHPYSTNYILIAALNVNYLRKNLKEAQKFLRDEESYGFRNVFDRSFFLLTESSSAKAISLAKNDLSLKLTRVIFRYRNNLDELFDWKPEPSGVPPALVLSTHSGGRRKSVSSSSAKVSFSEESIL